jgi:hypothetical protein
MTLCAWTVLESVDLATPAVAVETTPILTPMQMEEAMMAMLMPMTEGSTPELTASMSRRAAQPQTRTQVA